MLIPLRARPGGGFYNPTNLAIATRWILSFQPDGFSNYNPMDFGFSTRLFFEIGLAGIKWKTLYKNCQGLYDGYKENKCS